MIDSILFAIYVLIAFLIGFKVIPFIIDLFILLWSIDPLIIVTVFLFLSIILLKE